MGAPLLRWAWRHRSELAPLGITTAIVVPAWWLLHATQAAQPSIACEQTSTTKAVDLLSGPGGLASFLRRGLLEAKLGGPSLPLDVGWSENIPAAIRNAVVLRDRHCRFPGRLLATSVGLSRPSRQAQGPRWQDQRQKLRIALCLHDLIVIHQWGWTLALNGDGTTMAWNKDRTKVLYSHGPPARAG
jgi:hypothetical protein